jgi:rhodanese-related sulfurtransferase
LNQKLALALAPILSTIAASVLQAAGFHQVFNVVGGFDAWRTCKLPHEANVQAVAS